MVESVVDGRRAGLWRLPPSRYLAGGCLKDPPPPPPPLPRCFQVEERRGKEREEKEEEEEEEEEEAAAEEDGGFLQPTPTSHIFLELPTEEDARQADSAK